MLVSFALCTALAAVVTVAVPAGVTHAEQASNPPGAGRQLASHLATGRDHTCAIVADGSVRCWGSGSLGQLGYGNTHTIGDDELPEAAGSVPLGVGRTAVALAAGDTHTCAILDDATVRCWGAEHYGWLGYGSTANVGDDETPADKGPVFLGAGRTAVAIAAGRTHTCAILDDGNVRCWGQGLDGRLGYGNEGSIGDDELPGSVGPVFLGAGRTAVAITAGTDHTCVILDDGSVRCWGIASSGQLGYGNGFYIGDDELPGSVGPVSLGAGRTAVAITAGAAHTCVILDIGSVRCWGSGSLGQLGYGNTNDVGDDEVPSSVSPVSLTTSRRWWRRRPSMLSSPRCSRRLRSPSTAGGSHTCVVTSAGP